MLNEVLLVTVITFGIAVFFISNSVTLGCGFCNTLCGLLIKLTIKNDNTQMYKPTFMCCFIGALQHYISFTLRKHEIKMH